MIILIMILLMIILMIIIMIILTIIIMIIILIMNNWIKAFKIKNWNHKLHKIIKFLN